MANTKTKLGLAAAGLLFLCEPVLEDMVTKQIARVQEASRFEQDLKRCYELELSRVSPTTLDLHKLPGNTDTHKLNYGRNDIYALAGATGNTPVDAMARDLLDNFNKKHYTSNGGLSGHIVVVLPKNEIKSLREAYEHAKENYKM